MSEHTTPRELENAIGPTPDTTLGYLASPGAIVAALVAATAPSQDPDGFAQHVDKLGGVEALRETAAVLETWMRAELGRGVLAMDGVVDRDVLEGQDLLKGLSLRDNHITKDWVHNGTRLIHLSGEIPGVHAPGTLGPSDAWRTKLAEAIARRVGRVPVPTADDLSMVTVSYQRRLGIRSNDPLLSDIWTLASHPEMEHAPPLVIEGAAAKIAMVQARVHLEGHRLRERMNHWERRIEGTMRAALGETGLPEPTVIGTTIDCVHFNWTENRAKPGEGSLDIGHFNVTLRATMPNDMLKQETVEMPGNLHTRLDLFDDKRHVSRLRKRGATARSGGVRFSPVLKRCMERDGVDGDALLKALSEGTTGPAKLGFGRDVRKILVRAGIVDVHLELAPRVTMRAGSVHMPGMDLADTLIDQLVDQPLAKLVDHPMVPATTITRMTRARTGSLIARTSLAA